MNKVTDFIGHSVEFDPEASKKLIESASLEEQYSSLTEEDKKAVMAKLLGYKFYPPTVLQLVEDEYFLGGEKYFNHGSSVFDFWKKILSEEIFSGEFFTKKPYLILSGAINNNGGI